LLDDSVDSECDLLVQYDLLCWFVDWLRRAVLDVKQQSMSSEQWWKQSTEFHSEQPVTFVLFVYLLVEQELARW